MKGNRCCALIITYHPPANVIAEIEAIRHQCDAVLVIDNGSNAAEVKPLERLSEQCSNVELICNGTNVGLASALNQGCGIARERGFEWILFLDQDTEPFPNMVESLLDAWRSHPQPERVGVIGSNHYDELGQVMNPRIGSAKYEVVPCVITSGAISPLRVFAQVGPFRDDFFIDYIDIEFGYRLESRGMESLLCLEPTMRHMWGTPHRFRLFGRDVMVTNHSPFRRYFIARNGSYVLTRYWLRSPLRLTISIVRYFLNVTLILIMENERWKKAKAMFVGFWHGLFGRMGPCPAYIMK